MNKKVVNITLLLILLVSLISISVNAATISDAFRGGFLRITDFLTSGWMQYQKTVTFLIFFFLFLPTYLMGMKKAFGEISRAHKVFAVTAAFTSALIIAVSLRFDFINLKYIALALLGILGVYVIYSLLSKVIKNKLLALILALIIAALILWLIWYLISGDKAFPEVGSWFEGVGKGDRTAKEFPSKVVQTPPEKKQEEVTKQEETIKKQGAGREWSKLMYLLPLLLIPLIFTARAWRRKRRPGDYKDIIRRLMAMKREYVISSSDIIRQKDAILSAQNRPDFVAMKQAFEKACQDLADAGCMEIKKIVNDRGFKNNKKGLRTLYNFLMSFGVPKTSVRIICRFFVKYVKAHEDRLAVSDDEWNRRVNEICNFQVHQNFDRKALKKLQNNLLRKTRKFKKDDLRGLDKLFKALPNDNDRINRIADLLRPLSIMIVFRFDELASDIRILIKGIGAGEGANILIIKYEKEKQSLKRLIDRVREQYELLRQILEEGNKLSVQLRIQEGNGPFRKGVEIHFKAQESNAQGRTHWRWTLNDRHNMGTNPNTLLFDTARCGVGEYVMKVYVTDRRGIPASAEKRFRIEEQSESLVVNIIDPPENPPDPRAVFNKGDTAVIKGEVEHAQGNVEWKWSIGDGAPVIGSDEFSVNTAELEIGDHIVNVKVRDERGQATAQRTIKVVTREDRILTVKIVNPPKDTPDPEARFKRGKPAVIKAEWKHAQGNVEWKWSVDDVDHAGNSDEISVDTARLSIGNHLVKVHVRDESGAEARDSRRIEVFRGEEKKRLKKYGPMRKIVFPGNPDDLTGMAWLADKKHRPITKYKLIGQYKWADRTTNEMNDETRQIAEQVKLDDTNFPDERFKVPKKGVFEGQPFPREAQDWYAVRKMNIFQVYERMKKIYDQFKEDGKWDDFNKIVKKTASLARSKGTTIGKFEKRTTSKGERYNWLGFKSLKEGEELTKWAREALKVSELTATQKKMIGLYLRYIKWWSTRWIIFELGIWQMNRLIEKINKAP